MPTVIKSNKTFKRHVWTYDIKAEYPGVPIALTTKYCNRFVNKNDGMASRSLYLELASPRKDISAGKQADRFFNWAHENIPYNVFVALNDQLNVRNNLKMLDGSYRVFFKSIPSNTDKLLDLDFCRQAAAAIADTMRYFPRPIFVEIVKRFNQHFDKMKEVCSGNHGRD